MKFSYTNQASMMDNFPTPGGLTSELSRQEEKDLHFILMTVKDYLLLHGKASRRVYRIAVPRTEHLKDTRSVIEHASKALSDVRGWDIKFDLTHDDVLMVILSVPSSDTDEQINLFT